MRFALLLAALLSTACATKQQFRCDAPSADPWLSQPPFGFQERPSIGRSFVQPVLDDEVGNAGASLAKDVAHPLTSGQAAHLSGAPAPEGSATLRPWLVRAVFPVSSPNLSAIWLDERKLVILADGLGCAPFLKHPVVVWLDRAPVELLVAAEAAL
jgi:hypothetical protein